MKVFVYETQGSTSACAVTAKFQFLLCHIQAHEANIGMANLTRQHISDLVTEQGIECFVKWKPFKALQEFLPWRKLTAHQSAMIINIEWKIMTLLKILTEIPLTFICRAAVCFHTALNTNAPNIDVMFFSQYDWQYIEGY